VSEPPAVAGGSIAAENPPATAGGSDHFAYLTKALNYVQPSFKIERLESNLAESLQILQLNAKRNQHLSIYCFLLKKILYE